MSGLLRRKSSLSILSFALLILASVSFAAKIPTPAPDVVKLLPANGDMKGWSTVPATIVYASGNGLTEIYNGGFELYTKNGVQDAAQQMYSTKPSCNAMVTIHRMSSADSAKQFLAFWKKSDSSQKTFKALNRDNVGYVYIAGGATNGYLIRDDYFVTVTVFSDSKNSRGQAEAFLKNIGKSIGKLSKPAPKPECPPGRG